MPPSPSDGQQMGPYMLQELADDLPLDSPDHRGVKITCLEAWSDNLYVGTSAHEILHLVSMPSTPNPNSSEAPKPTYILASRPKPALAPGATGAQYIKQILLLPTVSKALVLSSTGYISFYSLPEFSPAYPGTKLKDVLHIGGLDLNDETTNNDVEEKKMVMILGKARIRLINFGETARLVKDIPLPGALNVMRRGAIACVATKEKYALLDVENLMQIPLFPLSSASDESPPREASPAPPPAPSTSLGPSTSPHPPRISSLSGSGSRERRASSAAATRESLTVGQGHSRSISAGNVSRRSSTERGSTARRGSTRGTSSRPASRQSHLSPAAGNSPRSTSPAVQSPSSPRSSTGSRSPTSPRIKSPPPVPPKAPTPKPVIGALKPHIASPTPNEFLLTTGTTPEDPGVGMFVNLDGDVTRGTISFDRYPEQILIQDNWVIAVIRGQGLAMQRWDTEELGNLAAADRKGVISFSNRVHLKEVLELQDTVVSGVGHTLRLFHVPLSPGYIGDDELPGDEKRNEEERVVAERISAVQSRVVVFEDRKVWRLLRRPFVLRLDSRLPKFTEENFDGIVARVRNVLEVLKEVDAIEPTNETTFHEVSYIRQKCGLLVLGELLRISARQTSDISAAEIIRVEQALSDSALDPRFIVALFGDAFAEDIVEGDRGVWVYGGIREVFRDLRSSEEIGNGFTRDVLMLLKRYLMAWREKKGFGSVADEKEVFLSIDAALLRVMLMLDSPEYLLEKGHTVVPEGDIRKELYRFVESNLENRTGAIKVLEEFGRLFVLSILYAAHKQYSDVLATWKRILESGDNTGEFSDGETRIKNYLIRLKDPELVEEYGAWLAERNPDIGIQVFSADSARVKLPPERVLEILRARAPDAVRRYVEFLVIEQKNTTYSNDLIFLYLTDLLTTLRTDSTVIDRLNLTYESYRALESPKPTYRAFIHENSPPTSTTWWHLRLRLLDLLGNTTLYDASSILTTIHPFQHVLIPELVILHGRMGTHTAALSLLVHSLNDFDTAINYCLFGGQSIFQPTTTTTTTTTAAAAAAAVPSHEQQCTLFSHLLTEFLHLSDPSQRIAHTAQLLERFGPWLDVAHVLAVVPESWSIAVVAPFLLNALSRLVKEKHEAAVARALGRALNLRAAGEFVGRCDELGPVVEVEH